MPLPPTAMQIEVLGQSMPLTSFVVPDVCAFQVAPPFTVTRIVPPRPAAKHVVVVGQSTACRVVPVPEVSLAHVLPPSPVPRINPAAPTAVQTVVLAQSTAINAPSGALGDCWAHPVPPSVVETMTP